MTAFGSKFSVLLLLAVMAAGRIEASSVKPTREARATLVIYNTNAPESEDLARYYAGHRGIPEDQIIGLACPLEEEITREQYRETIEEPLIQLFGKNNWWSVREGASGKPEVVSSRIRFVALMRGIPLKIRTTIQPPSPEEPPPPRPHAEDPIRRYDEAAVDSELAVLGAFTNERFGILVNPYFRRFAPILDSPVTAGLLLVARLDAPSPADVRRMIDDTLLAERIGLYGWAYIDRRSIPEQGYRVGDDWLQNAASECWSHGIPVILDNNPAIFPEAFPVTNAALYYGWYSSAVSGAMGSPQFQPGAIAVHIHSFSAATLRHPDANWAAPLIVRGAAATLGNVYEPYLDLTPHLDVFNERLLQGFTFAESVYMGLKVLSWMTTVVGDPLYRPFAGLQRPDWRRTPDPEAEPWIALKNQLRQASRSGPVQVLQLARFARENPSGLNYEALGMAQSFYGEPREALASLESAGSLYQNPAESFRTVIERIRILQSISDKRGALQLIDRTVRRPLPPDRAKLLRDLRLEIDPPPPTPVATPAP